MSQTRNILIVANRTAVTSALLDAVRQRARAGTARFHLLVPAAQHDFAASSTPTKAGLAEARERLAVALPFLSRAAGRTVTGATGDSNAIAAIEDALDGDAFDEVVISTLPRRVSRWMRLDVVSRARALGVAVTHVEPRGADACVAELPRLELPEAVAA